MDFHKIFFTVSWKFLFLFKFLVIAKCSAIGYQATFYRIELWLFSAYHKPFTLTMCDTDIEVEIDTLMCLRLLMQLFEALCLNHLQ